MAVTVKLHGSLANEVAKEYRRNGIKVEATRLSEVLSLIDQLFPITRDLWKVGAEFRIGSTIKSSRALTLEEATHGRLCGINNDQDITLHIVPGVSGKEITTAMIVTALVSSAISIGVSLLINALFPPTETDGGTKRKSALYASGLNTQKEGVPLAYVAGKAVLCGTNFIETDVDVMQSGLAPSFTPGPGAVAAGVSGGLAGQNVSGGSFPNALLNELYQGLLGSKGGGKTRADNMFSYAKMKMLGAVGAGPMGGIVGTTDEEKAKNIFIEQLPLWNAAENRLTHDGVLWAERLGVEGQDVVAITPAIANVLDRNEVLVRQTVAGTPGAIIEKVSGPKVARIKARVAMALLETSKKGNQYETDMAVAVHTRRPGGPWQEFGTWHWRGKSSSAVQSELIVNAPAGGLDEEWEFMIERITPDSTSDRLQNETSFNGWTEIIDSDLRYDGTEGAPATALFAMSVDAAQFDIQNPPEVAAIWQGRLCRVPHGYNPQTRTYPAFWDGTWDRVVTDNPVWHWLEIATDPIVGGGYDDSYFNKGALLECAKFCDQMVNGRPRYTLNKQFTDQKPIKEWLSELAKTFRANVFFGGDQILLVQDRPQDWVNHFVNNAMVANGQFTYDRSEVGEQFNEVIVQWDDPKRHFQTFDTSYRDEASIARNKANGLGNNGVVSNRVYKIGCTNEQEAFDYARLLCWISLNETKTVTWDTLLGGAVYSPGQLVEIDDWYVSGKSRMGRVKRVIDANNFELDGEFAFKANTSYQLHLVNNDGQEQKNLPMVFTDTTTAAVRLTNHGLVDEQPVGIVQVGGGAQPVVFRIIDIAEKGPGIYTITAQQHVNGKFAWAEQNVPVPDIPTTEINVGVPKPEGFFVGYTSEATDVMGTIFSLEATWNPYKPPEGIQTSQTKVMGWDIRYVGPGDDTFRPWERVYKTVHSVRHVSPGQYLFQLRAINTLGATSEPVEYIVDVGSNPNDLEPPIFEGFF